MVVTSRFLRVNQQNSQPVGFLDDPTSAWNGYPNKWKVILQIEPAVNGDDQHNYAYDGLSIQVGDWLATTGAGIACRVVEIAEPLEANRAVLVVLDEDNYNILADQTQGGQSIGPNGQGVLFQVDAQNGMPILGPLPPYYMDNSFQSDIIARFIQQGKLKTPPHVLQDPLDGNIRDGAITSWTAGETSYTNAIDDLNSLLKRLLPGKPPALSEKSIQLLNVNDRECVLSQGFTNNSKMIITAGSPTVSVSTTSVITKPVESFGSGENGTLSVLANGKTVGSHVINGVDDVGVYDGLEIISNKQYPGDTGYWRALTASASTVVPAGYNDLEIIHSETGRTTIGFAVDTLVQLPTASAVGVSVQDPGIIAYSSGVPHFSNGSVLKISATLGNLAGQTHLAKNNVEITSGAVATSVFLQRGQHGIPSILAVAQSPVALVGVPISLDAVAHTQTPMQIRGRNSYSDGALTNSDKIIHYMSGTPTSGVVEQLHFVGESIVAKRISMGNGDMPDDAVTSHARAGFVSGSSTALGDASASHEAVIRGGRLLHDLTNYSLGYLPVGPDYRGKADKQYAVFVIQGVTNNMRLRVNGTHSGIFVKLPGIAQIMPNATNGWWDALKPADFAPSRWPGSAGASNGCSLGESQDGISITFGSASSAGSTDNMILIRFKLVAGQNISDIAIDF